MSTINLVLVHQRKRRRRKRKSLKSKSPNPQIRNHPNPNSANLKMNLISKALHQIKENPLIVTVAIILMQVLLHLKKILLQLDLMNIILLQTQRLLLHLTKVIPLEALIQLLLSPLPAKSKTLLMILDKVQRRIRQAVLEISTLPLQKVSSDRHLDKNLHLPMQS